MIVYRFDEQGFYKEPVKLKKDESVPIDCTIIPLPEVNYKPRFVNGEWVEALSQTEIEALKNAPREKSELEILKETVDQLVLDNLMRGL